VQFLSRFVAIPSPNPPGDTTAAATFLLEHLRADAQRFPEADAPQLERVIALIERDRATAYERVGAMLRDPRYVPLLDELVAAAEQPVLSRHGDRPAGEVAPLLIDAAWRKLRASVRRLSARPRDRELHRVRIQAKRLRYVAEATVPVHASAAALATAAEALQTILGDQHDGVVGAARLRELEANEELAFGAGELAALAIEAAQAGRVAWPAAWRKLKRRRRE